MLKFVPSKDIKTQDMEIATEVKNIFDELGYDETLIELRPQCGAIYQLIASNGSKHISKQICLQFNPLDINLRAAKKILKKEANVSSVERGSNKYFIKWQK